MEGEDGGNFPVTLNVYDLSQGMARQLSLAILGQPIDAIYHTGVVVYGKEYWFGNGIEQGIPGRTYFGPPLRALALGNTAIPESIFNEFLQGVHDQFNPSTYSLLHNNCNHFSEEAAQFLLGSGIPRDILDLPMAVLNSPQGNIIASMLQGMEASLRSGHAPGQLGPGYSPGADAFNGRPSPVMDRSTAVQTPVSASSHKAPVLPSLGGLPPTPSHMFYASEASKSTDTATASTTTQQVDPKKALEEEIKREFTLLMAIGNIGANEAAAQALKRVRARRVDPTKKIPS